MLMFADSKMALGIRVIISLKIQVGNGILHCLDLLLIYYGELSETHHRTIRF